MKKYIFSSILLFFMIQFNLFSQEKEFAKYQVLLVKGDVHNKTTNKKLQKRDKINSTTELQFGNPEDFICIINISHQQHFMLKASREKKSIKSKISVSDMIYVCYNLRDRRGGGRYNKFDFNEIENLKDYFGESVFLVLGTEQTLYFNKTKYPDINNTEVILKYKNIHTKLAIKDHKLFLKKENIFSENDSVHRVSLSYGEEKVDFALKFMLEKDLDILKTLLIEVLYCYKDEIESREEQYEYFYQAVYELFGNVDEYHLNQFFEKNITQLAVSED